MYCYFLLFCLLFSAGDYEAVKMEPSITLRATERFPFVLKVGTYRLIYRTGCTFAILIFEYHMRFQFQPIQFCIFILILIFNESIFFSLCN